MQLSAPLGTALRGLLGVTVALAIPTVGHVAGAEGPLRVATDTLVYTDDDNVLVVAPQLAVHHALDERGGEAFARVAVDTYTCASVDVVSHATRGFSEVRGEATLGVSHAFGDVLPSLLYRASTEPDYVSHGFGGGIEASLGTEDTTGSADYVLTLDTVGRSGTPFDTWSRSLTSHAGELALTQVLGKHAIVRVVYSLTAQQGYMEKPYRFVPLFEEASVRAARDTGVRIDLGNFDRFRSSARPPEEVPESRLRHAVAARAIHFIRSMNASARLDYRFYVDSWGLTAHTVEAALEKMLAGVLLVEVRGRAHFQSAADFWRREYMLDSPDAVPRLRTVDRDLSSYDALTGGARLEVLELLFEPLSGYVEGDVVHTTFRNYLFLDSRVALVAQAGLRWEP